jgi:hypothetical protein
MTNCLFVCLQQIYYLRKNFQKTAEEVTSSLLPTKSRDAYYKELNDFNNWKQENYISGATSFMSKKELF